MKEESIFVEYSGSSPLVRILNFLILGKDFDYSMTEIAEGSGVGWTSFTRAWTQLVSKKAVMPMRTIGKAKLFTLNTSDRTVQKLVALHWDVLKEETNKFLSAPRKIKV